MFISAENAQRIVDEIKAVISQDLNIMDNSGIIIASTDSSRINTLHQGAQELLRKNMDILVVSEENREAGTRKGINLPIHIDGKPVGVIGITGEPDKVADFGSIIQKMTEIMIIETQQQAALSLQETARFNFVEYWLFSDVLDPRSLYLQAGLLNIDLDTPRIVAMFEQVGLNSTQFGETQSTMMTKHLQTVFASSSDIYISVNNHILVLFAEKNIETVRQKAHAICNDLYSFFGVDIYAGVSQPSTDFTQLRRRYKEALNACRTAAVFRKNRVTVYNETSLYYIVQAIPSHLMEELKDSVFRKCTEKEVQEMTETLELFFRHDGNTASAAAEIFIHPNSYLYRLNKITAKTSLNPRKPHDCAILSLLTVYHILTRELSDR